MSVSISPIPAFQDNYIWLLEDTQHRAVVVDPGDAEPVQAVLAERGLDLHAILITHHHPDHVGGVLTLKTATGCKVYGPRNPEIEGIDHPLKDGDQIDVLGESFEVLEVGGHTLDHIAYLSHTSEPALFCGDTLFVAGCGRMFEGTPPLMYQSLARLAALPPQTAVYCAHEYTLANLAFARAAEPGNSAITARIEDLETVRAAGEPTVPSSIAWELKTNPFLRCGEPTIVEQLQREDRLTGDAPHEIFAALRRWKDNF
ncbi:hydroxyacylglutathione hydrolase [Luminiphilus syltensis NOR5-1B]|uniref:Hydroxyacylglutathione hydrolase n=1 Tax=Luminiphilus syltensis NOR5-1B TaxID=565045 RepID=B8KSC9_9GAMM|nr:hydroxyacylglutathione hydrolase [Luminiphilus syltensis]EED35075.1 hydroxyacylglutathione hydrolase [Luminiphilus syltensis NOR5-1B]